MIHCQQAQYNPDRIVKKVIYTWKIDTTTVRANKFCHFAFYGVKDESVKVNFEAFDF